jgi:hypothetical protein
VDLIGQSEYVFRFQHRHDDGTWGSLEPRPAHHDSADLDPEREWVGTDVRLYKCTTCDEEVRVIEERGTPALGGG